MDNIEFVQMFAELLGTALLVLLGNGAVSNVLLKKTKGSNGGILFITTGWFLAVFVAAVVTARVSGAHLNPAVTLAMILNESIDIQLGIFYMIAQMLGGFLGACLVWLFYNDHFKLTEDKDTLLACFCTGPAVYKPWLNFFSELVATCVLLLVIFAVSHPDSGFGSMGVYFISCGVWAIGISLGGTTGYALNPARDLSPRLAHALLPVANKGSSHWEYSWIPVLGPLSGAVIAVFLFQFLY